MKDLAQLKESILQEVTAEYSTRLEVVTNQEEEKINHIQSKIEEQLVTKKMALKKEAKSQLDRQQQSVLNQQKKEVLQVKHELLEQVYTQVVHVLSNWSGETLLLFIEGALSHLPTNQQMVLTLGEETIHNLPKKEQDELQHHYPHLTISEKVLPKQAGFVVTCDGVEYNYLFEELVKELKEDFSPILALKAFK